MFPSVARLTELCPHSFLRLCASLALVSLLPWAAIAQTKYPGPSSSATHNIYGITEPVFMPMPLVAPVFLQTDQIDSSITVVNSIVKAANGTVTLRDQQGNVIGKQVLSFPAHSSTPVAVKTLLAAAGSQAHSGSITLEDDPSLKGSALVAQLSMTLHSGSQPSFLEEEFGMPSMHGSTVLQGVASQTRNLPVVAITSVSDAPQTIHVTCVGENKTTSTIELPSFGTAVVQACSWTALSDASLNLASNLLSGATGTETDHAISLTSDSVAGSFYAFGFAVNGGLDQPQLQPLDFYDPGTLPSSSIIYAGVPTGTTSVLSSVLSAPVLTLANFSAQVRHTAVTWSDSSSGTPKVRQIADVTLPPFSTQTTTLSAVTSNTVLNTFTLASDGRPGDVQAHLFTRVGSSQQRTELLAKDSKDDHNGGNHPWSIANGDVSTLLLYNKLDKPQLFHLRISGEGGTWLDSVSLAPYETKSISINELVSNQKPDGNKRTLPLSLKVGEVQWNTEFGATGTGRVLVTNAGTSLARNFSCDRYFNMCFSNFAVYNYTDVINGQLGDLYSVSTSFCTELTNQACSQNTSVGPAPAQAYTTIWTNNSTNVIQMRNLTNTDLTVQGINLGTFSVAAYTQAGSCQSGPMGGGGTVKPSLSVSNGLFYNYGNPLPAAASIFSPTAVVTASGASGGTFKWSVSDATKVSFSPLIPQASTSTTANTVTIYAAGPSLNVGDVTISLNWTGSAEAPATSVSTTETVDSPYLVTLVGVSPITGVYVCAPPYSAGNNGWVTVYTWRMVSYFGNALFGMNGNESFSNTQVFLQPGYGYHAVGFTASSASNTTFTDTFCAAYQGLGSANTLPPQNPPLTNAVDSALQTYSLGSATVGAGVGVRKQQLVRYPDHITVSPVQTHR